LFLSLSAALAGCGGGSADSVVLITLDTLRIDALGAYGCSPSVTPNLDALAADGVVFDQAYTVAPLTLPAHASMFTGLVPPRHGVRDNGVAALPQSAVTLAERAKEAGLQTAAFLGSVVLDQGFGLEQGFERYEAPARPFFNGPSMGYAERPAIEVATMVTTWLHGGPEGRDPRRPFFLWVHLWDAHAPYAPAPEDKQRAGNNDYLGEVLADDTAVGHILAALRAEKLFDSALVIAVADHGEAFAEHGEFSHGPFVWNTTLRVPLILRLPGGDRAGERVATVASVADVFPTALAALGLEPGREELDGLDLLEDVPDTRGAYFESYYGYLNFGWHPLAGWIDGQGKSIHATRVRFFDPVRDPKEEQDLAAERAAAIASHRGALLEVAHRPALARDAEGIDPELKRALQAVGYAAFSEAKTEVPPPLATLALPDPFERAGEIERFQRAQGLLANGKLAEAESALRALVEANPDHHAAWDRLALCLMRMDRHREAVEVLESVLSASPGNADTWSHVGACRLVTGEPEKALAAFRHALELDPNHVQSLGGLVHLMESAGLGKEAGPVKERFEAVRSRP
jgi:arylsulfatase A-like enzyme